MLIVDANIVLRYLLLDNVELAEKASEIIENNNIFLPFEVKQARLKKNEEQKSIHHFIDGVDCPI